MANEMHPCTPIVSHIVLESAAKMPSSCWGTYRRVGVLRLRSPGSQPRYIRDTHAATVVRTYERLHVGTTDRDAYTAGLRAAVRLAAELDGRCI